MENQIPSKQNHNSHFKGIYNFNTVRDSIEERIKINNDLEQIILKLLSQIPKAKIQRVIPYLKKFVQETHDSRFNTKQKKIYALLIIQKLRKKKCELGKKSIQLGLSLNNAYGCELIKLPEQVKLFSCAKCNEKFLKNHYLLIHQKSCFSEKLQKEQSANNTQKSDQEYDSKIKFEQQTPQKILSAYNMVTPIKMTHKKQSKKVKKNSQSKSTKQKKDQDYQSSMDLQSDGIFDDEQ